MKAEKNVSTVKKKYPGFYFRCSPAEKRRYQQMAKEKGIDLTKLIKLRLDGDQPIKDYTLEKQFFGQLHELTKEMGHIGNNINQVTMVLHQINNSQKIEEGEYRELAELLKQYMESRDKLSHELQKAFFR